MINPKYEIYKGSNKKFYFRLKSGNGQIVLQSQGYSSRNAAMNGIKGEKR